MRSTRLLVLLFAASNAAHSTAISQPAWSPDFAIPSGCNGHVNAVAEAADGSVYLGGNFTACGETVANRVVRFDPLNNSFHALGTGTENGVNGLVQALAVLGGEVFVGGDFNAAGSVSASNIARFDGTGWHALGGGLLQSGAASQAQVRTLLERDGSIFVGGRFSQAGPVTTSNIARYTGGDWFALGSGIDQPVLALAWQGDALYAGSGSLSVPTSPGSVRRLPADEWETIAATNGAVTALGANATVVYAGGAFTEIGGAAARRLARFDGAAWSPVGAPGAEGANLDVLAILAGESELIIGGAFTEAGGIAASRLARFDGITWSSVRREGGEGEGEEPDPPGPDGVNRAIQALAGTPSAFYAAGFFDTAGDRLANHATVYDGEDFASLGPATGLGLNGQVNALVWHDGALVAGGAFTRAGVTSARRIARLQGGQWAPLGEGMDAAVFALAADGERLFAGGDFIRAGDNVRNFVARWDGAAWNGMGPTLQPGLEGEVRALALEGDTLFVGGRFTETRSGIPVNRVAQWQDGSWSALGPAANPGVNNEVHALSLHTGILHLGGFFSQAGGISASRIARFDLSGFSALAEGIDGQSVRALFAVGQDLYVGGRFNAAGTTGAANLAIWDGMDWLDPEADLGTRVIEALGLSEDEIVIGGNFTAIGPIQANRIAAFDGENYTPFGDGIGNISGGEVRTVLQTPEGLFAAGRFGQAGEHAAGHLSLWRTEIIFADGFEAEPDS